MRKHGWEAALGRFCDDCFTAVPRPESSDTELLARPASST
jgi:hypothetical protein